MAAPNARRPPLLFVEILAVLVGTVVVAVLATGMVAARQSRDALLEQARALAASDLTVLRTAHAERERTLVDGLRRAAATVHSRGLADPARWSELIAELAVLRDSLRLDVLELVDADGVPLTGGADSQDRLPVGPLNWPRLAGAAGNVPLHTATVAVTPGGREPLLVGGWRFDDGFAHLLRERVSSRDDVVLVAGGAVVGSTLPPGELPPVDRTGDAELVRVAGTDRLVQYAPVGPDGAAAVGVVLRDPVGALGRSLARGRALSGLVLGVLVVGLGWACFRALTRPLVALTGTAAAVAGGDLDARFETGRRDEIGRLAGSLQRMTDELRRQAADLRESARRIVSAHDVERRRLARDLHDGAQQRLVSLALALRFARRGAAAGTCEAIDRASDELGLALAELRELARGIHPAVLTDGGLAAALESLADRSVVPVTLQAVPAGRYTEAVEATVYFVVSEALANAAKHAQASAVTITVRERDGRLLTEVADDGVGGARVTPGSGLEGLADRAAALGGVLRLESPPGGGTTLRVDVPCA